MSGTHIVKRWAVIMAILARLKLASPLRQRGVISIHYKTLIGVPEEN